MIIIAENFNSSIPHVHQAMQDRNTDLLRNRAKQIAAAGADYLDINAGTFLEHEAEMLQYLVEAAEGSGLPYVIDSPDPDIISFMLNKLQRKNQLINSITLETERFNKLAPIASEYDASLIALLMDGGNIPEGVQQRLDIADQIISKLREQGINDERILLDPMIKPLATDSNAGQQALDTIYLLRKKYPQVHITCGLSNISFGLPSRKYLNRAFLLQAMAMGLDSAIMNPLDQELLSLCHAGISLAGNDEYCMEYLEYFRPENEE